MICSSVNIKVEGGKWDGEEPAACNVYIIKFLCTNANKIPKKDKWKNTIFP
jgi:hypothetical protein